MLYNTYPQARELMETIDLPLKKYPEIANKNIKKNEDLLRIWEATIK